MKKLVLLNGSGDESIDFDRHAYSEAEKKFNAVMGTGYGHAFALDKQGISRRIKTFDPEAEEVILVGPYAGG